MADKMQKLIKVLKRVEKDTKIHKEDVDGLSFSKQVNKYYPDAKKLCRELLLEKDLGPNQKNIDILEKAGYSSDGFRTETTKGLIIA